VATIRKVNGSPTDVVKRFRRRAREGVRFGDWKISGSGSEVISPAPRETACCSVRAPEPIGTQLERLDVRIAPFSPGWTVRAEEKAAVVVRRCQLRHESEPGHWEPGRGIRPG
jgi:hypothetical protein